MPDEPLNLQFDRAEYAGGDPGNKPCASCQNQISGQYYASGEALVCAGCADRVREQGGSPRRGDYLRGLGWGIGATVLGSGIYFLALQIGFGRILGAILVGYLVGKSVRRGSHNRGSRAMQVLAVSLTYLSLCGSLVPMVGMRLAEQMTKQLQAEKRAPMPSRASVLAVSCVVGIPLCLTFPIFHFNLFWFLAPVYAMWEAWKINRPLKLFLSGPFTKPQPPPILP